MPGGHESPRPPRLIAPTELRGDRMVAAVGGSPEQRDFLRDVMEPALARGREDRVWMQHYPHAHVAWRRASGYCGRNKEDHRLLHLPSGLRVSTDPLGIEPVFTAAAKGFGFAASELLPVAVAQRALGLEVEPEPKALIELLARGHLGPGRSLVKGVRRLRADESVLMSSDGAVMGERSGVFEARGPASPTESAVNRDPAALGFALRDALTAALREGLARSVAFSERTLTICGADAPSRFLTGTASCLRFGRPTVAVPRSGPGGGAGVSKLKVSRCAPERLVRNAEELERDVLALSGSVALDRPGAPWSYDLLSRVGDRLFHTAGARSAFETGPVSARDAELLCDELLGPAPEEALWTELLGEKLGAKAAEGHRIFRNSAAGSLTGTDERRPHSWAEYESEVERELADALLARMHMVVSLPYLDPKVREVAEKLSDDSRRDGAAFRTALWREWSFLGVGEAPPRGLLDRFLLLFKRKARNVRHDPAPPWWGAESNLDVIGAAVSAQPRLAAVDPEALVRALREGRPGADRIAGAVTVWAVFWNAYDAFELSNAMG